ncbi:MULTISPECIES: rRNA maturation RNase YbeY [Prochlorococcus]|uniref:Endoribonuclease YbeY n=1 Tax=Prochlorococcus marinus (strain SARG / CCMP1375 / SS120) TaxID=167539 RepID=YBEY_PROMA|nr:MULTISPECIES: rRNA maturation RNase YbeY [Prochlorococcus]Q7VE08.1 RecName: Full=Endoribonuclease YbeY [Prochlorococcus marinus subsp. marinus str. CCMP1375]AAP99253.1 Predicted metal-dependent hydrolase [Prochlorococcus marinus subsp. marinus str. CCMP1375]KGG11478.1 Metal-dependent hydrolase YbeY [Prochlorococcus marinus str. LG]KGG18568.1 Metal-dependent hydrolase YbeY [Prochlorococcus marinus str. SS2]KGG22841.1 Metal-dependent hydrolase YbeY [Prochlorococcus marinus str. SS35]KGG32717
MQNLNDSSISVDLTIDLSLSGFTFDLMKDSIDSKMIDLIMDCDTWRNSIVSWFDCILMQPNLTCPQIVRKNRFFSMGLLFTNDLSIRQMNKEWRKKDESTDVLSFPAIDEHIVLPPNQFLELGDIIVSVETAFKQAKIHNHSLMHELRWLVSHGFLHLLGWDHPSSASLNEMLSFQELLLKTPNGSPLRNSMRDY